MFLPDIGAAWEVASLSIFCFVGLVNLSVLLLTEETLWIWRSIGPSIDARPSWWPTLAQCYFLFKSGSISFAVLPLVSTLPYSTSFIPFILSKTIRSLSLCLETGSGRLGYCVHLLQLWFCSHLSVISMA